jgi:hypothetical protein
MAGKMKDRTDEERLSFSPGLNLNLQMVLSRRQGARPTLNAVGIYLIRLAIYVIRILKDE